MNTQITKAKAKTLKDFAAEQKKLFLPGLEPNGAVLAALEDLGRVRLSKHYFMRDFLYSEVAVAHGIANVPDDAELAIKAGRGLCENLLEPLRSVFGHVTIRSAFRSANVNGFGAKQGNMNIAGNEANFAHHIWDHRDPDGHVGATACIVIPWFVDWLERYKAGHDWRALAWFIHDHLPYSEMVFFAKNTAVNLTWRCREPKREIRRRWGKRGERRIVHKAGYPKRDPAPEQDYPGFPDPNDPRTWVCDPPLFPSCAPTRPRQEANLQERARGLMIGLAVGNVLGVPLEGWARHAVEASYPDGVREMEVEPGEPDDDDLAQAIVLAEAAIETDSGSLDVDQIGRLFWEWAEENGRGIGIQTSDVLSRVGGAMPRCALGDGIQARVPIGQPAVEAAREAWEESGRYSAGNGAVMRCAPLAIRWMRDDTGLARNTALSTVVTHADPRCVWSAVLVNVVVAKLLRGEDVGPSEVVERTCRAATQLGDSLAAFGIAGPVPETVLDSCSIPEGAAPADLALDGRDMGYTLKAMQVALWCANQASDFEEAMVAVVSAGGDTDTNGAIAGAVLGARFGLEAIPDRWRARLAEIRQGSEPLETLGDRLVTV